MQRSTSESLNQLINDYLHRYNVILNDKPSWIIKRSKLDGFGVFARQDIQPGEIIFKDYPIILGPRVTLKQNLCSICYNDANLTKCFSNCGLTLCTNCEKSVQHRRECEFILKSVKHSSNNDENGIDLLKSLPVIRGVLLDDQDKEVVEALKSHTGPQHEVQVKVLKDKLNFTISAENERFMRLVCGAFDANAFETPNKDKNIRASLRGLYPLASLANHNCTPNTFHIYDENYRMIVRASDFIKENTEIFHTYTRITWGTLMRRYHLLHTKRFLCKCDRCLDPKEKNTYIGSILCPKCKGNILVIDTSKLNSMWKCEYCEDSISSKQVRNLLILLDSTVCAFVDDDVDLIKKFIDNKLKYLVSEFNEIVIEAKYKFIWIVGYSEGFLWNGKPKLIHK